MRQKSGTRESSSERLVKNIRRVTRKQYSSEEKIRIVLDGLRGEFGQGFAHRSAFLRSEGAFGGAAPPRHHSVALAVLTPSRRHREILARHVAPVHDNRDGDSSDLRAQCTLCDARNGRVGIEQRHEFAPVRQCYAADSHRFPSNTCGRYSWTRPSQQAGFRLPIEPAIVEWPISATDKAGIIRPATHEQCVAYLASVESYRRRVSHGGRISLRDFFMAQGSRRNNRRYAPWDDQGRYR